MNKNINTIIIIIEKLNIILDKTNKINKYFNN